jgi:hypothetical protein
MHAPDNISRADVQFIQRFWCGNWLVEFKSNYMYKDDEEAHQAA